MAQEITTVLRVISDTKDAEKGQENLAKNIDRTSGSIDNLIKRLEAERDRIGRSAHEYELYRAKMAGATQAQLQQIKALQDSVTAHQAHTASMQGVNNQLRFMRGGFGQVGHQIQDIAVQLQMGTNAMLVFGQQGSQIASLFGPGGAMIGALAAVGAAFFTYYQATKEAKKGTKELREESEEYAETVYTLIEAESTYLAIQYGKDVNKKKDRIQELTESLTEQEEHLKSISKMAAIYSETDMESPGTIADLKKVNDEFTKASENIAQEQAELSLLNRELEEHQKILTSLQQGKNPFYDSDKDPIAQELETTMALDEKQEALAKKNIARQAKAQKAAETAAKARAKAAWQDLRTTMELDEKQEALIKKQLDRDEKIRKKGGKITTRLDIGDPNEQLEALAEKYRTEQAYLAEHHDILFASEEDFTLRMLQLQGEYITNREEMSDKIRKAEEAANLQMWTNIVTTTQNQTDTLAGMFEETSGIAKAFYVASQAMAAANAIINGYAAASAIRTAWAELAKASKNPGMALAGEVQAGAAVAMGYATAGAIAGQTIASFEGGGITFDGIRAGGMDGKGGRVAVVHPNEKITDMTQDGSGASGVNVNFSIVANDTRGFDELLFSRRGQIVKMINQAMNNRGQRGVV